MDLLAYHIPEQLAVISTGLVESWFAWGGYFVLFGLLFACGLGLPLPEDIPLLAAGFFVAQERMDLGIVAIVAWLGIIGGDCMLYSFGRRYGLNVTRVPWVGKHFTQERILKAEELFDRWGIWVVGVGRMFAGVRGAMVVAAGAIRFNFFKFLIADGIAAIFSGGLFVALGYWAGLKLGTIEEMRRKISGIEHYILAGLIVCALCLYLYLRSRKRAQKPPIADVALTKVIEKAHKRDEKLHRHEHGSDPPVPPAASTTARQSAA
jgi:membrane protein DedA with SNARE-associated domain